AGQSRRAVHALSMGRALDRDGRGVAAVAAARALASLRRGARAAEARALGAVSAPVQAHVSVRLGEARERGSDVEEPRRARLPLRDAAAAQRRLVLRAPAPARAAARVLRRDVRYRARFALAHRLAAPVAAAYRRAGHRE